MRELVVAIALVVSTSCSGSTADERTIVASIYPLAFAAERLAGSGGRVVDLTPPGVEAHDVELTLEQRSQIQDADFVLYLGDIGFQPQVEQAVEESDGTIIDFAGAFRTRDGVVDPHVWLEPGSFIPLMSQIRQELCDAANPCTKEEMAGQESLMSDLGELSRSYLVLQRCRFRTMIVSHEAFGYVADANNLVQFGLTGLTPEAEPSADRLGEARRLVEAGEAAALFYEARGEDVDADRSLADDLGVPAIPLDTLESEPPTGDYLSVMRENLEALREGLQCQ